ncbi:MAG: hypothetical protein U0V48_14305 [Anaerolineales bacterium]
MNDNDDKPVGLILSRRDMLKLLGVGGAAFLASCAAPQATSTLIPALTLTAMPTLARTTPASPTTAGALPRGAPRLTIAVFCGRPAMESFRHPLGAFG